LESEELHQDRQRNGAQQHRTLMQYARRDSCRLHYRTRCCRRRCRRWSWHQAAAAVDDADADQTMCHRELLPGHRLILDNRQRAHAGADLQINVE